MINHTRLRFIRAKKVETIIKYVNQLGYKIEIKGGITWDGKKYLLAFIPPDEETLKEAPFGDLD
jgi:hypothetical protein